MKHNKNIAQLIQKSILQNLIIGSLLMASGCQKDDNFLNIVDLPTTDLCLTGFVTPDSIYLVLGRSVPYNYPQDGTNPYLLPDTGLIWVQENGIFFDTLQVKTMRITNANGGYDLKKYYTSNKKPVEGNTYHIYAWYPGFHEVEAEVFVPYRPTMQHIDTVTFFKTGKKPINPDSPYDGFKDTLFRYLSCTVWFKDSAGEENFYRFPLGYTVSNQPIIQYRHTGTFDDRDINGKRVPLYFETEYESGKTIEIELLSIDRQYFTYLIGVNHILEGNKNKLYIGSNFFEPIVTYSNTSNNMGMVAGYAKSTVSLQLP